MKRKFNVVDYVIIFIIILAIIAGVYFLNKKNSRFSEKTEESDIRVLFYIPDIDEVIVSPIKIGNKANDNRKKTDLGVVDSIKLGESKVFVSGSDGISRVFSKPNYVCADIKLRVKGHIGSDGIYIGRYKYLVGDWVVLNVGQSTIYAVISGVER